MMQKYTAKYAKVVRSQPKGKREGGGYRGMPAQLEVYESLTKAVWGTWS